MTNAILEEMMLYSFELGYEFDVLLEEANDLKSKNNDKDSKHLSFKTIFRRKEECPHLYKFTCHLMKYPGSNAHLERFFSVMTKVLPPWRSRTSSETFNLIAFIKGNMKIFAGLLLGHDNAECSFVYPESLLNDGLASVFRNNSDRDTYFEELLKKGVNIDMNYVYMYQTYMHHFWWIDIFKNNNQSKKKPLSQKKLQLRDYSD